MLSAFRNPCLKPVPLLLLLVLLPFEAAVGALLGLLVPLVLLLPPKKPGLRPVLLFGCPAVLLLLWPAGLLVVLLYVLLRDLTCCGAGAARLVGWLEPKKPDFSLEACPSAGAPLLLCC